MNYKELPFTEENLKLEGAEVWHKVSGKAKYVGYMGAKTHDWFIHWDDDQVGWYGEYAVHVSIRITGNQYTVGEVWDEVKTDRYTKWDHITELNDWKHVQVSFARRIAELAKSDQLKLD